ncbi:hypothetical protein MBENS4_2350 [Novosphingobium sp. MBES04]|nr:hypothetical protein MBENS4_2350 [Novosphingobium sp. MBES04]
MKQSVAAASVASGARASSDVKRTNALGSGGVVVAVAAVAAVGVGIWAIADDDDNDSRGS